MKVRAVAVSLAISIPIANAYTGDLTHYSPGEGSCGQEVTNGQAIVALSTQIMAAANPSNPNDNPYCGKQISIHNPTAGTTTTATVADTCEACAYGSIDVMLDLFNTIAPNGDGRVHGIQWTPIGWSIGGSGGSESASAQPSASSVVQPSSSAGAAAPSVVQPSSSVGAAALSAALPTVSVQEKLAAAAPPAAAASKSSSESSSAPAAPSSATTGAPSSAASPSNAPTAPAPTSSNTASCPTPGVTVCSADGTQIGTCTSELTVQFGPVAAGTKCEGGWMVMANSRLRSRRGY